ncbi:paraflagellar rod protein, putative [Bodo saltans]|uniref:Paraflagellar rod protein, putative n=1 Tax=Bodo saltans TaxID=75058 RepID=A0A0S4IPM7_BODSA|nr:paraflagellar rod protein, putative [Bodo saltans]|eukprot:CUF03429.1 paraflagellar rod protein, putative [Bodo saltans]
MASIYDLVIAEHPHREQQLATNRRVEGALEDEVERAISIGETFGSFVTTRLPVLEERNPFIQAALQEYDSMYRWPNPCGWNEPGIMQRCQQQVSGAQLRDWLARPKPNVFDVANILKDLSGAEPLQRGKFLLRKEETQHFDNHQDAGPAKGHQELSAVTIGLYEVLHADILAQLRAELAESDVLRAKLQRSIEKLRTDRDQALALSEMANAEQCHKLLIDAHYEMCELCARRLDQVHAGGRDDLQFKRQMEDVKRDAEDTYNAYMQEKTHALSLTDGDIERCASTRSEEEYTHNTAMNNFQQLQQQLSTDMQANLALQHQLVEEIRAKLAQLSGACESRKQLVENFALAKVQEEQRIASYVEFVDLTDQHMDRLKQLREYTSRCTTMAHSFEEYRAEMFQRLSQKDLTKVVELLAREEAERFHKEYRDFVFACGDLSTKKMHRFDTLERQVRLTKHHRDTALDSLDPKIHKYNEEIDQLVGSMRDTEGILTTLQASQDSAENMFKIAEDILRAYAEKVATRPPYLHPLQEFGGKAVEDRRLFVERALRFVEDEERQVSLKRDGINKMRAAAAQEQLQHTNSVRSTLQSPYSGVPSPY